MHMFGLSEEVEVLGPSKDPKMHMTKHLNLTQKDSRQDTNRE